MNTIKYIDEWKLIDILQGAECRALLDISMKQVNDYCDQLSNDLLIIAARPQPEALSQRCSIARNILDAHRAVRLMRWAQGMQIDDIVFSYNYWTDIFSLTDFCVSTDDPGELLSWPGGGDLFIIPESSIFDVFCRHCDLLVAKNNDVDCAIEYLDKMLSQHGFISPGEIIAFYTAEYPNIEQVPGVHAGQDEERDEILFRDKVAASPDTTHGRDYYCPERMARHGAMVRESVHVDERFGRLNPIPQSNVKPLKKQLTGH